MIFEIHSQSTIHDALKVTFSILTAAFGLLRTVSMFFLVTCSWEAILSNMLQHYPRLSSKVRLCLSDPQMAFVGTSRIFRRLVAELVGGGSTSTSLEEDAPQAGTGETTWAPGALEMGWPHGFCRVFPGFSSDVLVISCDWWNIRVSFLQVQVLYHTSCLRWAAGRRNLVNIVGLGPNLP